jgi:hypothetical protein
MRRLILTAAAALTLAACGKTSQTDNANVVGDKLTAESIVSNDVTAIDAVTGDAANMAADVDMNEGNFGNEGVDEQPAATPKTTERAARTKPAAPTSTDNAASPANSATNAD